MSEAFDKYKMENLSKKYPEYDTMRCNQLEDLAPNSRDDLLEMDDKGCTDIDEHNEKSQPLNYANLFWEKKLDIQGLKTQNGLMRM